VVYFAAPRLDPRLAKAIVRLDDASVPMAETLRRCRAIAAELDLPRPSYESVRLLLHEARREKERRQKNRDTLIGVALYLEPPDALYRLE
jgi:hypothetical protein